MCFRIETLPRYLCFGQPISHSFANDVTSPNTIFTAFAELETCYITFLHLTEQDTEVMLLTGIPLLQERYRVLAEVSIEGMFCFVVTDCLDQRSKLIVKL